MDKKEHDHGLETAEGHTRLNTVGGILHEAAHYDFLIGLATFGQERALREKVLDLARLETGEHALDVGCGTGTLAVAAKERVGSKGSVYGIDASPEMIAKAEQKAKKAGVEVVFKNEFAQTLPFSDAQFDVVFSTLMLHHLPQKARHQCASEMRRVLRPGGRVLAVDFGAPLQKKSRFLSHFHHGHGHVNINDIIILLNEAGFQIIESGALEINNLHFALAETPHDE